VREGVDGAARTPPRAQCERVVAGRLQLRLRRLRGVVVVVQVVELLLLLLGAEYVGRRGPHARVQQQWVVAPGAAAAEQRAHVAVVLGAADQQSRRLGVAAAHPGRRVRVTGVTRRVRRVTVGGWGGCEVIVGQCGVGGVGADEGGHAAGIHHKEQHQDALVGGLGLLVGLVGWWVGGLVGGLRGVRFCLSRAATCIMHSPGSLHYLPGIHPHPTPPHPTQQNPPTLPRTRHQAQRRHHMKRQPPPINPRLCQPLARPHVRRKHPREPPQGPRQLHQPERAPAALRRVQVRDEGLAAGHEQREAEAVDGGEEHGGVQGVAEGDG